jgi:hypothetical protein
MGRYVNQTGMEKGWKKEALPMSIFVERHSIVVLDQYNEVKLIYWSRM